jgi:hypothetical protein
MERKMCESTKQETNILSKASHQQKTKRKPSVVDKSYHGCLATKKYYSIT